MSQQSAFKQLYSEMFKNAGDFARLNVPKKQIKCYVKESFPHFLVTDNYFYVACYFTKKAVDEFKSKFSNMNITDLKSRVIMITDWTLEMNRVNSADVFTSYGGLEVKLIVRSFKPNVAEKDKVVLTRHPINLYRDDEMKTLIQNYTHTCLSFSVQIVKDDLPDISKMSAKDGIGKGVVSFAAGNSYNGWGFKDGKTPTVDINSIFKQEKGADALKSLHAPAKVGKAKVLGGPSKKSKQIKKTKTDDTRKLIGKINKFTPNQGNKSAAKKSTHKLTKNPQLPSPGGDRQNAGTTDHTSMKEFQKMIQFLKNKGKSNLTKRGKGSVSSKTKGDGKKSSGKR